MTVLFGAIFSFVVMCLLFDFANKKGTTHKDLLRNCGHLLFCVSVGLFIVVLFKEIL